ncbi:MAG: protein-disulfide reductase DsbD domain-containing protein [Reichenbachiella sp.]|uniref:protein-disulfide reductase DsbD domain-containing protein n=1 Tax=Reichenbachiella sp. TaxID=2184521 RepID=UPI0032631F21
MKVSNVNRWCLGLVFLLLQSVAMGQILTPAKWSSGTSVDKAKVGDIVELVFTADLDDTWYIYSSDQDPNVGPLPAVFTFEKDPSYKLVGEIQPIGVKEKYDEIWDGTVRTLKEKAEFRQKVKILKKDLNILVLCEYQVCTTVDGKCIPGDEEFEFDNFKVIQ